jgi:hypothetical protein
MDEATLLCYKTLWAEEKRQHNAESLPHLNAGEQAVYRGLKTGKWGHHVRLEQERIPWDYAWKVIQSAPEVKQI